MANTYIVAKNSENKLGVIGLSTSVFEAIALFCLEDINGVKPIEDTRLKKGVNCKVVEGQITIELNLAVRYGKNVNELSNEVQKKVIEGVNSITEFDEALVNVNVVKFYFD